MATRVTEPNLVSFHGFMRSPLARSIAPVLFVATIVAAASFLVALAPAVRAECGTASSAPCPTPVPVPQNAFLSLDVTSGDPSTVINVTGGQFLANEQMSLYWDQQSHVAGSATADGNGNFNVRVRPLAGDSPGVHRLCASVAPNPCANFTLVAPAPTPSPTPTPAFNESPSPASEATPARIATRPTNSTLNGFEVISRPPFVFLPLIGLAAIAVSLAYWVLSLVRRPRRTTLPSAAVVHRAMRPDYSAGFGTSPAPTPPSEEPSTGAATNLPPPPPAPEPAWNAEASPVEWGTGAPDSGYPFAPPEETREPGDPPPPTD